MSLTLHDLSEDCLSIILGFLDPGSLLRAWMSGELLRLDCRVTDIVIEIPKNGKNPADFSGNIYTAKHTVVTCGESLGYEVVYRLGGAEITRQCTVYKSGERKVLYQLHPSYVDLWARLSVRAVGEGPISPKFPFLSLHDVISGTIVSDTAKAAIGVSPHSEPPVGVYIDAEYNLLIGKSDYTLVVLAGVEYTCLYQLPQLANKVCKRGQRVDFAGCVAALRDYSESSRWPEHFLSEISAHTCTFGSTLRTDQFTIRVAGEKIVLAANYRRESGEADASVETSVIPIDRQCLCLRAEIADTLSLTVALVSQQRNAITQLITAGSVIPRDQIVDPASLKWARWIRLHGANNISYTIRFAGGVAQSIAWKAGSAQRYYHIATATLVTQRKRYVKVGSFAPSQGPEGLVPRILASVGRAQTLGELYAAYSQM